MGLRPSRFSAKTSEYLSHSLSTSSSLVTCVVLRTMSHEPVNCGKDWGIIPIAFRSVSDRYISRGPMSGVTRAVTRVLGPSVLGRPLFMVGLTQSLARPATLSLPPLALVRLYFMSRSTISTSISSARGRPIRPLVDPVSARQSLLKSTLYSSGPTGTLPT